MAAAPAHAAPITSLVEPDTLDLPVIDMELWLSRDSTSGAAAGAAAGGAGGAATVAAGSALAAECARVAEGLHKYGLLIVKDPRASEADNNEFLDMLESYFEQPEAEVAKDVRREFHYQVGTTPSFTELPRDHCERMKAFKTAEKPLSLCPPEKDPKMRFFWRLGERPTETSFKELNAAPVTPAAFPQWERVMNSWGAKLLQAVTAVAQMAAIGFGLPENTFSDRMHLAPHLLAPTASDLSKFGALGTVLAGFHYDLNALTIHGRSRYPGLYVWTRAGEKKAVKIPAGCLLVQAGKQMEYITGGHVLAGFHEVIVTTNTVAVIEKARAEHKSLWRISSTCFAHFASDVTLEPVGHFATAAAKTAYPAIKVGDQVAAELSAIKLAADSDTAVAAM